VAVPPARSRPRDERPTGQGGCRGRHQCRDRPQERNAVLRGLAARVQRARQDWHSHLESRAASDVSLPQLTE